MPAKEARITRILRVVDESQNHSKPVIEHCCREFLLQSHDPESREYAEDADQIREVLIHGNCLSRKDIEICAAFDPETLTAERGHVPMRQLHEVLCASCEAGDACSAG